MPRDWRNHPDVIERHCTCGWSVYEIEDYPEGSSKTRIHNDACPLHGNQPEHDLPPEFP